MISLPPSIVPSDSELVTRFFEGDDEAFRLIYCRYNQPITTFCARMLGMVQEAEEVSTEVFLKLVERRFKVGGSLRSFLYTVARRACIDRIRKRKRRDDLKHMVQTCETMGDCMEERITQIWQSGRVRAAINGLRPQHREVILLHYTGELSGKEMAEILGIEDGQVRSLLSYARKKLRKLLEDDDVGSN